MLAARRKYENELEIVGKFSEMKKIFRSHFSLSILRAERANRRKSHGMQRLWQKQASTDYYFLLREKFDVIV